MEENQTVETTDNIDTTTIQPEEKLDNSDDLNTISSDEDTGSSLSLDELFKTIEEIELNKTEVKEEKDDFYSSEAHSKQLEELNSQLDTLNTQLSEKDTTIQDITSKLEAKEKELLDQEGVLKQADELWSKIIEHKGLYDLVQKHINWENISIWWIIDNQLLEGLDAIVDTTDTSSDQVPPEWEKSLQDRLMGTRIRTNR